MSDIYLDYAATTPVDPRVAAKLSECLSLDGNFGNPASVTHSFGWKAKDAVEDARKAIADLINAHPDEIVFTSGATEANNLAITGVMQALSRRSKHFVTVKTEHKAVLDTAKYFEKTGGEVTFLNVDSNGRVDLAQLAEVLLSKPALVSVMMVNNETGVIQDIAKITEMVKAAGAYMHVDAVQAVGKMPVDVKALNIDLLSLTAHKIYGPKGIGVLYVRKQPRVPLIAQIHGGGHERGMRSGTLPTHQIFGLGEAVKLAKSEMAKDAERMASFQTLLLRKLMQLPRVSVNGAESNRMPHIVNICFQGVDGESLVSAIEGVAVSLGSACTSATTEPSHVLAAMKLSDADAHSSLRISFGRFTTEQDILQGASIIMGAVRKLRELSPVWEGV